MRASAISTPPPREADNELFDRGCDLVEAATAIRRAADSRDAGRAVPAVLGCIESAMQELLWASAALEQTTADLTACDASLCPGPRATFVRQRMHRGYANLQQALSDAQRASAAARALASRALLGGLSRNEKRGP